MMKLTDGRCSFIGVAGGALGARAPPWTEKKFGGGAKFTGKSCK